jgi:uncharacterized protein (TIGR03083 family)
MSSGELDFFGAIRADADALINAAERAGVDASVPSCPDWKVADLLAHIGMVHRWAAANCDRAPDDGYLPANEMGQAPDGSARVDWVRTGAAELLDVLAAHSADDPCWTWAPPQTVGFWQRRMAHETAMHRVDAQSAAGGTEAIDAELAADGIDEWLWLLPRRPWAGEVKGAGATWHFHCTDVEGEWLATLSEDGLDVQREHAKGDVAIRGAASDLLFWMMGRGTADPLEVFGDADLLDRWRDVATF